MKLTWKAAVALVIGGIALGGVASSFAADRGGPGRPGPGGPGGPPHRAMFAGPLVRSTTVVEGETDGTFKTLQNDAGELTKIDGNTLTVRAADGKSVEITVTDDTTFHRDRDEAELADLEVGDHVFVHRVDGVTEHVGALSAEQWARMEAAREACEADESSCRPRFHMQRRGGGGEGSSVDEAPEPAAA